MDTRCGFIFFFNDTATTEIYTLSLHDALRSDRDAGEDQHQQRDQEREQHHSGASTGDRKSTRLNSSHDQISYAVFCLKKKKTSKLTTPPATPSTRYRMSTNTIHSLSPRNVLY